MLMQSKAQRKPYEPPVLRVYGRMDAVTNKSFIKGGTKKDPNTPFRNRV